MSQKTAKFFLGIDGGGTKTAFMLCDSSGGIVAECTLAGCNPVDIGMERAKTILKDGIETVCAGMSYSDISVYAGIAGGITGNNKAELHAFFESFGFCVFDNNSDAMNAVAAGLGTHNGVAVIIGTGCVAFTKTGSRYLRTGGFGYLIDAGGDGYSIGRDALRYALYAEQRNEPETVLLKLLQEKAAGCITGRLSDIYAGGKAYIASFCPAVFEAVRKGDNTARSVVRENMECAAKLILEAADKLGSESIVPIVLTGSVARQPETAMLLKEVLSKMKTEKCFDITVSDVEPIIGAVHLAMEGISC